MEPKELGTRERRRLRLQDTIRREAFKLFAKQGYEQTTIEQIADAADISYSTFFRHFPSKDAIAFDMRFDGPFIEMLEQEPSNTSLYDALQRAAKEAVATLSAEDLATLREHYALLLRIPALQARAFYGLNDTAGAIGRLIAQRLTKDAEVLGIQTFAWALVGSWVAAFHYWIEHRGSDLGRILSQVIAQLEPTINQLEAGEK